MTRRRALQLALGGLALAFVATHIAALFTEGANWDEIAILRRAHDSVRTGALEGGGRPGLAVLPLLPVVDGCAHVMDLVRAMRLGWCVATFALIGGLFVLLRQATRRTATSWQAAALGTACLVLVPLFLRWSLHFRTDQPAVAASLWAGVALYASRDRWWFAALGGVLAATGYLCSQKAIYVVALVGVLLLGDLYIERTFVWRREVRRTVAAVVAAIVTVLTFQLVIQALYPPSEAITVGGELDLFRWYRKTLHYRIYRTILPTVVPHVGLLVLVFAAAMRSFRRDTIERRPLLVALVIMLLGVAIGRFHAACFPYFWLTIGVFPACAIALGYAGIRELLPRAHVAVIAVAWLLLVAGAVRFRSETLVDTQAPQRDSFAVAEQLPAPLRGFSSDGGLFCRADPDPLPQFFGVHVRSRFNGPKGAAYAAEFLGEHRKRPIAFLVRSNRIVFPIGIEQFWDTHYVPYRSSVWVAGRAITGPRDTHMDVDVLVAGRYRWLARDDSRVVVEGVELAPGQTIELAARPYVATVASAQADGILVLAIDAPPGPTTPPFYDRLPMSELSGTRTSWW